MKAVVFDFDGIFCGQSVPGGAGGSCVSSCPNERWSGGSLL